jgi:hypothetical protein
MTSRPLDETPPVETGEELAELLRQQHAELRTMLCRVPLLHDGAREDVFLRSRRLLAVHLGLESALLLQRTGALPDHERLGELVEAAERAAEETGVESIDFDAAQARVAIGLLRHEGVLETLTLVGQLSAREEEVVAAAVRLWEGRGDAYLGNTWPDMVTAVSHQLDVTPM